MAPWEHIHTGDTHAQVTRQFVNQTKKKKNTNRGQTDTPKGTACDSITPFGDLLQLGSSVIISFCYLADTIDIAILLTTYKLF